jgi:tetratricopeptide (TPR) repeat protein
MEQDVFSDKVVADYFNSNFISISVQTDQTVKDDEDIRSWYSKAKELSLEYQVQVLPTFLFFDPKGNLVYRASGYQDVSSFLDIGKIASDPASNFSVRRDRFLSNKMEAIEMRSFSLDALTFNDRKLADSAALIYYKSFLSNASDSVIQKVSNVRFIQSFYKFIDSRDMPFWLFFNSSELMDSLIGVKGASNTIVKNVIIREEVNPIIYLGKVPREIEPDWLTLEHNISKKYSNKLAAEIISLIQFRWYTAKENWQLAIKFGFRYLETNGIDTSAQFGSGTINDFVWTKVVRYGTQEEDFRRAVNLMENVLRSKPNVAEYIDTYANLLYKMGSVNDAILQEEKAIDLTIRLNYSTKDMRLKEFNETLRKMKANEPTWLVPGRTEEKKQ